MAEHSPVQEVDVSGVDRAASFDQQASFRFQDRLLSSGPVKALVGVAAALTPTAEALAIPLATDASTKPMKPIAAMRAMATQFGKNYMFSNSLYLSRTSVSAKHLVLKGKCFPGQRFPDTESIDDNRKNITTVYCTGQKTVTSRRNLEKDQEAINYKPLLLKLGQTAARSARVADSKHGNATYISATRKKMIVSYSKNPEQTGKQLHTLTLTVKGNTVKPSKSWY